MKPSITLLGLLTGASIAALSVTGCSSNLETKANTPTGTITSPASNQTIAPGQSVTFSALATDPNGGPVTVVWNFGDGTTSSALAPGAHTYPTAGVYTVTLACQNSMGMMDPSPATRTITVQANQAPSGTITLPATDLSITTGQSVTFAAAATDPDGDAVTVLWDFGDGTTSTALAPPAHAYNAVGTYQVTLTATDVHGLADPTPATRTITVQAVAANLPPVGTITAPAANTTIAAGGTVSFSGTATDPNGDAVTVLWNFGDGTTSTALAPGSHTYAAAGTYTVTFTATDSHGLAATTPPTRTITVQSTPVNLPPVGTITVPAANVTITAGGSVSFTGAVSDPNGDAVTVLWNFGDGSTSTALVPGAHIYAAAGTYTVTFTATDSHGLAATTPPTRTITVNPAVAAPTLTQVQTAVFNSCSGCHSGTNPPAGMNLSAGQTFSNTVNVNATTLTGKRIVPFSSATSALVTQVTTNGHHSPSAANLVLLKAWIDAGALNN